MKELSVKTMFENIASTFSPYIRRWLCALVALGLAGSAGNLAMASDHLDSPSTVANPQADIGDIYAWTSPEGRQLNLAMTIQGHTFSSQLKYTLHVDSGRVFGHTTASTEIVCQFVAANAATCHVGSADIASGDPTNPSGIDRPAR
jgi:hypothetical protein